MTILRSVYVNDLMLSEVWRYSVIQQKKFNSAKVKSRQRGALMSKLLSPVLSVVGGIALVTITGVGLFGSFQNRASVVKEQNVAAFTAGESYELPPRSSLQLAMSETMKRDAGVMEDSMPGDSGEAVVVPAQVARYMEPTKQLADYKETVTAVEQPVDAYKEPVDVYDESEETFEEVSESFALAKNSQPASGPGPAAAPVEVFEEVSESISLAKNIAPTRKMSGVPPKFDSAVEPEEVYEELPESFAVAKNHYSVAKRRISPPKARFEAPQEVYEELQGVFEKPQEALAEIKMVVDEFKEGVAEPAVVARFAPVPSNNDRLNEKVRIISPLSGKIDHQMAYNKADIPNLPIDTLLVTLVEAGHSWLSPAENGYSIQIMMVSEQTIGNMRSFVHKHGLEKSADKLSMFPISDKRYLIYHGRYPTVAKAKIDLARLPESIKKAGAYIIPMQRIRAKVSSQQPRHQFSVSRN